MTAPLRSDALWRQTPETRERILRLATEDVATATAADNIRHLEQAKQAHLTGAVERLHFDASAHPLMGYPDLATATGPMLPGQLWTVLARPENGKTTLLMNLASRWVDQEIGVAYFPTEEEPEAATLRFAAVRSGNAPAHVMAGEWERIGGAQAQREVQRELDGLVARPIYFDGERRPTLGDIRRICRTAECMGLPIVMLDHFHRMAADDGPNQVATMTETVRQIKSVAVETERIVVMAAQVRRTNDPLAQFLPPSADSGKNTGALEEESDVMLGLYRPLKRGVTQAQLTAFKQGELERDAVSRPHTMGVKVVKHRRNADLSGRSVFLHVERGMVWSAMPEDRES